jgi:hypothetical protein
MQQTTQVPSPMSMSQVAVGHGRLPWCWVRWSGGFGGRGGLEVGGSDEAEGQQPGRLVVLGGAVGFDEAAVDGLTTAVFLELALELLERGAPHAP